MVQNTDMTRATSSTENRDTLIDGFLSKNGFKNAERQKLPSDASFRRYERIVHAGKTYMLMDAPPPKEDVRPFIHIAKHLKAHGFSAPTIVAEDTAQGFLLLEDLGNESYTKLLQASADLEETLYRHAIEALVALHALPLPQPLAPYNAEKLLQEVMLLPEWLLPLIDKSKATLEATESYKAIWQPLIPKMLAEKPILVLRDYHADNLMWLPERQGNKKVGMLDFQDALAGHTAYDLVSLLEDARRDVPRPLAEKMIQHYLSLMPNTDEKSFRTAYALLGAQRNCKILGIFARLYVRDGKAHYLKYLPRVWAHVEHDLQHPALVELKAWLERYFSPEVRRTAPKV